MRRIDSSRSMRSTMHRPHQSLSDVLDGRCCRWAGICGVDPTCVSDLGILGSKGVHTVHEQCRRTVEAVLFCLIRGLNQLVLEVSIESVVSDHGSDTLVGDLPVGAGIKVLESNVA